MVQPIMTIPTAKARIRSTGKYSAKRDPMTRPIKIPPVTAATDAAAVSAPNPPRSRSKSALQIVRVNSTLRNRNRVMTDHQNSRGNGWCVDSRICSSGGTRKTLGLRRMRRRPTTIPMNMIHTPARQPRTRIEPSPIASGESTPPSAARAFASVSAAGPAFPSWSKRNALAPMIAADPKNEAIAAPNTVMGNPPGAV